MAGNISALCFIGPEKLDSASRFLPVASATEPILPDVSSANTRGSFVIFLALNLRGPQCWCKSSVSGPKRAFFCGHFSKFSLTFLLSKGPIGDIIG